MDTRQNKKPLILAGIMMGSGLGGFFDGILFHQLLQIHSMLSAKYPPENVRNLEINMFWDGLFHALAYTMTIVGLVLLWKAGRRADVPWSGRVFSGAMLAGWGLFNFTEGIINHHILHVHHVMERYGLSLFDYAFLASGLVLVLIGRAMITRPERTSGHRQ